MEVNYAEGTIRNPEDERLLESTNAQLRDLLDESAVEVTASWSRTEDGAGRPLFLLRLSRWTLESSLLAFTADDLRNTDRTWWRLMRAYQEILRRRSRELILELQATD